MAFFGSWNVDIFHKTCGAFIEGAAFEYCMGSLSAPKSSSIGSIFNDIICNWGIMLKQKGRFVVEAAVLVPFLSLMLVYMIHFTLYVHDYTVCAHTLLESGVKGIYTDGRGNQQRKSDVEEDLKKKLNERLLWIKHKEINVQVNPAWIQIQIDGTGTFLSVKEIETEQKIYRIHPCETIRRSRWIGK